MNIQFKYLKEHTIPNELRLLTECLSGYSFIDDSPIYDIKFDLSKDLLNDLLFDVFDKNNHVEEIKMYLRTEKTKKLLYKKSDKMVDKFVTFLEYYLENINHMIILKTPVST